MLRFLILAAFLQCSISQQYQQKVAPGVPPQNYQNYQQPPPPPPPQQYQQQQQFQQQQQQQQQQQFQQPPPPQQPPQQAQFQQPPPTYQQQPPQQQQNQQGGHGHAHQGDPQLLNPTNIAQERDHIQEHMEVPIDTSKMSEQELQFHYFKMHDADNNNKLDGCELIKSLIHWHGQVDKDHAAYTDQQLEEVLELALNHTDLNKDGYVDYMEYKFSNYKAKKSEKDALAAKQAKDDGGKPVKKYIYKDSDLSELVEAVMKQRDLNKDGFIEFHEYKASEGSVEKDLEGKHIYKDDELSDIVESAMKQIDRNNDGYIEYHEFKEAPGSK